MRRILFLALIFASPALVAPSGAPAQPVDPVSSGASGSAAEISLAPSERAVVSAISARTDEAYALLERLVEINSGTLNPAGVRAVGEILAARFRAIGFETEWVEMPPEMKRGPHLVAHRGAAPASADEAPPKVLLIGHLDTVFEADDPFQHFVRSGPWPTVGCAP